MGEDEEGNGEGETKCVRRLRRLRSPSVTYVVIYDDEGRTDLTFR